MKCFLVLLALTPFTLGAEVKENLAGRSISSQVVDAIEAVKERMPCGFPGKGIPPMAPLRTEHKDINISIGGFKAFGEFNNFRMDGLNDFDIVEFKVSPIFSRANFKFNWNHVYLTTDYEMLTGLESLGLRRSGKGKFAIKDLTVWGVVKYSLGVISGNLRLKEFRMYMSLGEVHSEIGGLSRIPIINKKLNKIIEEWIMLAVNDNTDNIADLTNSRVVPIANNLIGDMGLSEIIGIITGGGSGSGESAENIPCVPPLDD